MKIAKFMPIGSLVPCFLFVVVVSWLPHSNQVSLQPSYSDILLCIDPWNNGDRQTDNGTSEPWVSVKVFSLQLIFQIFHHTNGKNANMHIVWENELCVCFPLGLLHWEYRVPNPSTDNLILPSILNQQIPILRCYCSPKGQILLNILSKSSVLSLLI